MPPAAQRGGGSTRNRSGFRNPGIQPALWHMIVHFSRPLRLDPYAVAAVSKVEGGGRFGEVGDGGTSFGPFQLHVGGALPAGRDAAWANSAQGVLYAMQHMATVAGGLVGLPAVRNIVYRFERPAAPGPEVTNAWAGYKAYGSYAGGGNTDPGFNATAGNPNVDPGFNAGSAAWKQFMAAQMAGNQNLAKMLAQLQKNTTAAMAAQQQQFAQSLASQAAQARQQALSQQLAQKVGAARTAQQTLSASGLAGGVSNDPATALYEQRKGALQSVREQALRRAGIL